MSAYWFLRQDLFGATDCIELAGHTEVSASFGWVDGRRFDRPFPHETFALDDAYGRALPDFFDTSVPVMSTRMIDSLVSEGVSNLDTYPVTLRDQRTGTAYSTYRAINVVGVVDAIDLASSEYELRRNKPRFTGRITIDPSRVGDLHVFRLPCSPRFIVVDRSIAERLLAAGLRAVLLQPTVDYRGT